MGARITSRRALSGSAGDKVGYLISGLLFSLASTSLSAAEVGTTAGNFSVSPTGSASYTIPIAVPPGIAGMQPALAITYDSSGGNGPLGVGFALSGLSQITRCPTTFVQDGYLDAVDFDDNDKLCLDGQRLIVISGTHHLLSGGTEFRTEPESFSRIVSYRGGSASYYDPGYFKVWTKSGVTMEFGSTVDSRLTSTANNKALTWLLNKITDLAGNSIVIEWQKDVDAASAVPAAIHYAYSGLNGSGTAANTVTFTYEENRVDSRILYVGGAPLQSTKLLKTISSPMRTYQLEYGRNTNNGYARLKSVAECNGGSCLPPTEFTWQEDIVAASASVKLLHETHICANGAMHNGVCNDADNHYSIQYPDINGDGLADICYRGDQGINCFLNSSSGFSQRISTNLCANGANCTSINFADFTGNGRQELVFSGPSGLQAWYLSGTTFQQLWTHPVCATYSHEYGICNDADNYNTLQYPDINGDGRADVCYRGDHGVNCFIANGSGPQTRIETNICAYMSGGHGVCNDLDNHLTIQFVDMNGDGMADLVYRGDAGVQVWRSTGTTFEPLYSTSICANGQLGYGTCNDYDNFWSVQYPDINGDGLADICYRGDSGVNCFLNTGTGPGQHIATNICANDAICHGNSSSFGYDYYDYIRYSDVDGDGLADLIYRSPNGIGIWRSTSTGFEELQFVSVCGNNSNNYGICNDYDNHRTLQYVDVSGNGLPDIVFRSDSGIHVLSIGRVRAGLLSRIKNGLGAEIEIDYAPLTAGSPVYSAVPYFNFPVREFRGSLYVVSKTRSSDGIGGLSRLSYSYAGAKLHLHGHGLLGFSRRNATNETAGIGEITTYRQDVPYVGLPSSIETRTGVGQLLSSESIAYKSMEFGNGNSRRYFVFPASTVTKKYEIYPHTHQVTTATRQDTYDDFGNLTESIVEVHAGYKLPLITRTRNVYQSDMANWRLDLLVRTEVTRERPSGAANVYLSATRVSTFEYDPATGLLFAEIIEPSTPLEVRTEYGRDSHGNVISKTVSGPDFSARTSREEFSAGHPYYRRFNTRSINALGHAVTRTFDPATGNVISTADPNGLVKNFTYDAFGRKTGESFNQHGIDTWTRSERLWCSQITYCGSGDVFAIRTTSATGAETYAIFDMLQRESRRLSKSPDGSYVEVLTEYNSRGQVARKSSPRFLSSSYTYWTTYTYDALGRVIQEDAPIDQDAPSGRISRIEYNGLVTRQFDALNGMTEQETDVLGNVVRITDPAGGQTLRTYDAFNNLITTTDAGNAVTQFLYDVRGRKIQMKEPNMGSWIYQYNALGELIRQVDAKGQVVEMTYDLLGRMIGRTEREGTTTWEFDTLQIGALTEVVAPNNSRRYTYYSHGAIKDEIYRISAEGAVMVQAKPPPMNPLPVNPVGALREMLCREWSLCEAEEPDAPPLVMASNTIYTPPADFDGRFTVSWGSYHHVGLQYCGLDRYILEMSRVSTFSTPQIIYEGLDKKFQFLAPEPGTYYFRVRALYRVAIGLDECKQYPNARSDYFIGANSTEVLMTGSMSSTAMAFSGGAPVSSATTVAEGGFFESVTRYDYDLFGRPARITYPSGFAVENSYNASGVLDKVHKASDPGSIYWQGHGWDEWGNAYLTKMGNGVETLRSHDAAVGHVTAIMSGLSGGSSIQSLNYGWDVLGNLKYRSDSNQGNLREDFEYDPLNRLTRSTLTGVPGMGTFENLRLTYAANGNITSKSDVGEYVYGPQPHAVSKAGTAAAYAYDGNGNLVSGAGRTYTWASYNLPLYVTSGVNSSEFLYGPERQRIRQTIGSPSGSKTIYYAGALYEEHHKGTSVERKHYIKTPAGMVAIETWYSSGAKKKEYLHKDHLGSTDVITNEYGQVVQRMAFDAFGKRRGLNWTGGPSAASFLSARGFTGHEHLDHLGLIHMNGRVYDPTLGRFISADPFVQAPGNTQSYNRYSYVMNNPLSLTDPTGFFWKKLKKFVKKYWRPIVAVGLAIWTGGASLSALGLSSTTFAGALVGGAIAGGTLGVSSTLLYGGSMSQALRAGIKGAALGAATGGLLHGANALAQDWNVIGRSLARGGVGGISGELSGTDFRKGFYLGFGASLAYETYRWVTRGDVPTVEKGGEARVKSEPHRLQDASSHDNNFGPANDTQEKLDVARRSAFSMREGSPLSEAANEARLNPLATFHDDMGSRFFPAEAWDKYLAVNPITWAPAMGVTYAAMMVTPVGAGITSSFYSCRSAGYCD